MPDYAYKVTINQFPKIMRFLLNILATIIGLFLFFGILFLIMAGIASSIGSPQDVSIESNSVLRIELNKPIVERETEAPFNYLPFPGADGGVIGLINIKEAIETAKEDNRIKGIYLDAGIASGGFASLKEIRDQLLDFKASGKFLIGYSEMMSERAYYVASAADELYLNPEGIMEFNGFFVETAFFKGTLEKIGIEPQIFRVGNFKSAVEPFIREDMSEESREQTEAYLNSLYTTYLDDIAKATGQSASQLKSIADSVKVNTAKDAAQFQLVKATAYYDEVLENIRQKLEVEDVEDIEFVSLEKYQKALKNETEYSRNRIAVIVANGQILPGEGEGTTIGGETFAKEIRKARLDDNVKAVVLRINSPGGSALASDVIWREVVLTKQVKPVIASMSDVAASGGYYIAMGCDTIVAQPNTITGSIGIFALAFNATELVNKLGITTDIVSTSPFADILNPTSELSEHERMVIQKYVNDGYETFVSKAAEGRNMSVDAIKQVASGRVWSGTQAKERNLVDVLGGLDDAVQIAVDKAGLEDDYRVKYYPETKTLFEQIVKELGQEVSAYRLKKELGLAYPLIKQLKELENMKGVQARLPYDIEIK